MALPSLSPRPSGARHPSLTPFALPAPSADATETTPLLDNVPRRRDACTPHHEPHAGVVEVQLRRSWTRPWRYEPSASVVNQAGRVPLDIDDVAGVTGRLLGDSPLGPIVTCSLLLVGAYFSAASAVGACHLYVDLRRQRQELAQRIEAIEAHLEFATHPHSLEAWRNVCVRDAAIAARRQALQVPCAVGGSLMAVSILCNEQLMGRYSEAAVALGAILTWVGAPAMIAFTAGTGIESVLCARAHSTGGLARRQAMDAHGAEPWATAAEHTEARGRRLSVAHGITAASGFLMAAGLGLIYAVGAWGLVAMLPGLVGLQFGMHGRQKHTQTGNAAHDVARLVHAGSLEATAQRIGEVADASFAARRFAPDIALVTELPAWVDRLRSEDLFEQWALQLGRHAQLRAELGEHRRASVTFDARSISSQTIAPALRAAVAEAIASTYTSAGVVRQEQILRVLTDFYIEQLKLLASPA